MSIIETRLREAMAEQGVDQAVLASMVGCTQGAISQILLGNTQRSRFLPAIAAALNVDLRWLMGQTDHSTASGEVSDDELADRLGLLKVQEIDLALGMGATFLDEGSVQTTTRYIPEEWVRDITDAPVGAITIAKPVGDSMYPTINDRDIVFIDQSARHIDRQDAIWALSYGGLGTVKRVRAMPDGSFKIMSDNPSVREETAVDGEMYVLGRIVGVLRRT